MPKARDAIDGASYDPQTLKMLGQVFDEAWTDISARFSTPAAIEAARGTLANLVLALAAAGVRDAGLIKSSALSFFSANATENK